jgi:hypothetical protein
VVVEAEPTRSTTSSCAARTVTPESRVELMARGPRKVKTGTSMGGLEETPERKKRHANARKKQEQRWAAKSGPVNVYYRDPVTGEEREQHGSGSSG